MHVGRKDKRQGLAMRMHDDPHGARNPKSVNNWSARDLTEPGCTLLYSTSYSDGKRMSTTQLEVMF